MAKNKDGSNVRKQVDLVEMVREKGSSKGDAPPPVQKKIKRKFYEAELNRLTLELVRLQYWVKEQGLRLVIVFEGRDAAGKGGVIKTITAPLNPRSARIVALGIPSDRERSQWYFQRYVAHLPAAGEIVIFDRSWYNRAGVERVMGYCADDEYWEFLRACPDFERMLVRSGIVVLKYWLSVSDEEQEKRFQDRAKDPTKRWKLSPIDIEGRMRWVEFSKAKDIMMEHTDIPEAPWFQLDSDDKKRARLNCIRHLLSLIPYEDVIPGSIKLKARPDDDTNYKRPPRSAHAIVPDYYSK
jgi:polyphosphate kinase 2